MGIPFTQVAPTDCSLTLIFPEVDHRVRGVPLAIRADLSGADPLCFQIPPHRDRVPPNRGMASSHRPIVPKPQVRSTRDASRYGIVAPNSAKRNRTSGVVRLGMISPRRKNTGPISRPALANPASTPAQAKGTERGLHAFSPRVLDALVPAATVT